MTRFLTATAVAAGMMLAAGVSQANVTFSGPTTDYATAKGYENAFLSSLGSMKTFTENFEDPSFVDGSTEATFNTAVGTFTQITVGQLGAGLRILSADTTPFDGRRDMTSAANDKGKWLDSNDSREVEWEITFNTMITKLGFFMTDVNDVGASMTATFADTSDAELFDLSFPERTDGATNGNIVYVEAMFDAPVSSVVFNVNKSNDGWGIDDITVAAVPLPAGVLLLGLGLGGLVAYRRRQAA
jgi:hypothetical protein